MRTAGYKVIFNAQVHEARTLEAAATLVADVYPKPVRVKGRESLTRDRELTAEEVEQIAVLAARKITEVPA